MVDHRNGPADAASVPSATKRLLLVGAAILSLAPPAIGAWLRWGTWPPGFGIFPPQQVIVAPGFSLIYFGVMGLGASAILLVLLVPQFFGFKVKPSQKKTTTDPGTRAIGFPPWFWIGLAVTLASWVVQWFGPETLTKYIFTPLWWGFIAVIDGIVYRRTNACSIFSRMPKQLLSFVIMSIAGWYFFEWLNWFVLENWVYPNSPGIFTVPEAYFWFTLTYTCVWPAIFEWYSLLRTFPSLTRRWENGPVIHLSSTLVLLVLGVGTITGVLVGFLPHLLFFTVWLGSLLVLPAAMSLLKFWTPFTPIAKGNWTPLILMAIAGLCNGLFWEFWNHGSEFFNPGTNPNYWVYEVPYVNVIHLFSEMPLLGYFGYFPFGVQCWAWWLVAAHVLKFNPDIDPAGVGLPGAQKIEESS